MKWQSLDFLSHSDLSYTSVHMSASNGNGWIVLRGASGNNLRKIDVAIPRGLFTCVTGVSGSGKSTLVQDTLFPRLMYEVYGTRTTWAAHESLEGFEGIDKVIDIDQSPIGRTPRSNPATYTGTFDMIRELFAMTPDAKMRGYKNGRFSFNVKGGRCEACKGDGMELRPSGLKKADGRSERALLGVLELSLPPETRRCPGIPARIRSFPAQAPPRP